MRADKNDIVARFPRSMPWLTLPVEYQSRPFGFAQIKNGGVAFARLGSVFDTQHRPIACYASDRQAVHEAEYHIKYLGWMRGMNPPPVPMDNPRGSAIVTETSYWKDKFVCSNWESGNPSRPASGSGTLGLGAS